MQPNDLLQFNFYEEGDGYCIVHFHFDCPDCESQQGTNQYQSVDDCIEMEDGIFSCERCAQEFKIVDKKTMRRWQSPKWSRPLGIRTETSQDPKAYKYEPQPDITTYELARIVPLLLDSITFEAGKDAFRQGVIHHFYSQAIAALPEEVKRHFCPID